MQHHLQLRVQAHFEASVVAEWGNEDETSFVVSVINGNDIGENF